MDKKIFIGIGDTSGFYGRLNKGFESLGITSYFAEIETNKHSYMLNEKEDGIVFKCKNYFGKVSKDKGFKRLLDLIAYQFYKFRIFIYAICNFDVFIFTQCRCFWSLYELKLLKILKKTTVMFCLGSATRIPYMDGTDVFGIYGSKVPSVSALRRVTRQRKKKIRVIEKYVTYFINLPAQAQLCNKPFLSLGEIGIPFYQKTVLKEPCGRRTNGSFGICILHAASYLGCRGTKEFRQIIDRLKKNYDIEYIELSGVSNDVVLQKIQECDFVLDELYSDTPMATFATEAAWYGKPAVVGGYFAEQYRQYYGDDMCPPSLYVLPEKIEEAILLMIEDENFRLKMGRKAQQFVKSKMSCDKVAQRVMEILDGKHDMDWRVDPHKIGYIYGYGMSKELIEEKLKEIYIMYGKEGWELSEYPELEKLIYESLNIKMQDF